MPDVNEIEKKFLKIMGIEVHEWGFHDTEVRGSILNNPEINEYDGRIIRTYEYTETYRGDKCSISFITKGDRDEKGDKENEKKALQVVRGNLKYTLEYDESKKEWTVYVIEASHTDYSRYATGITARMDCGYFTINISGSMDGDNEISFNQDKIYYKNRYDGTKSIVFSPSNFEEILSDSISKIDLHVDDDEDLNKAFAMFIPLFLGEISQHLFAQAIHDIKYDPQKVSKLYDLRGKFFEYNEMKSRKLTETELEFLSSMGIESDGYDYGYDCDVLFDSDTCETFGFFGTRNIKDSIYDKRISTYMHDCTTVDLVEKELDGYVADYYYGSEPEKEIRILRNYMEYILQHNYNGCYDSVTLFIQEYTNEKESDSYYLDHKYTGYRVNHLNSPYVEVSYSDNSRLIVAIHGEKGFNDVYISADAEKIYDGKNPIPFTVEKFQECLAAKIQNIPNIKVRDEFMYQLSFLSVVVPMFLLRAATNKYSTCRCNHEVNECEECEKGIEALEKVEKSKLMLAQFDSYVVAQAENKKSGARQKNIGETSNQN